MSKESLTAKERVANLNLEVEMKRHVLSTEDMIEFANFVKGAKAKDPEVIVSLVDYVTDKFYSGQKNIVVVPDLRGVTIGVSVDHKPVNNLTTEDIDRMRESHLDLSKVDFTGANMSGVKFESCNLEDAIFCGTDLGNTRFNDCYMSRADMRGADISNCKLKEPNLDDLVRYGTPTEIGDLKIQNNKQRYGGMKFSTLEPLLHQYVERNDEILELAEKRFESKKARNIEGKDKLLKKKDESIKKNAERLAAKDKEIKAKQLEINEAYKKLGYRDAAKATLGREVSDKNYNQLNAELSKLKKTKNYFENKKAILNEEKRAITREKQSIKNLSFEKDFDQSKVKYIVHQSIAELPSIMDGTNLIQFDPAYVRGSNKEQRQQAKQYVRLTREDADNYMEALKENPELTINDFAKSQLADKGITAIAGAKIIADFSTYRTVKDGEYVDVVTDLSGFDWSGANLQESCFAGANLKNAKFKNANLTLATFEAAELGEAKFSKTIAQDANFFAAGLNGAKFRNSNFSRAYMPQSLANDATIIFNTNFNFSNIRNGQWDGVKVDESTFNYADMEGTSLAYAEFKRTKMLHAILNEAILEHCQMLKCDLTGATLRNADAEYIKLKQTNLKDVDATKIDLSDAEIDELCTLDGAELEDAIMVRVKADGVHFIDVHMDGVNLAYASLNDAVFKDVNMRFANLEGAILDGINAYKLDITGSIVTDLKVRKAKLRKSILNDVVGSEVDFTDTIMEVVEARGAKLPEVILERVKARKLQLQNADMEQGSFRKLEGEIIVNDGTNMSGGNIEDETLELMKENSQGKQEPISIGKKIEEDELVNAVKNKWTASRLVGRGLQGIAGYLQSISDTVRQPMGGGTGALVGAAIGAGIVISIGFGIAVTALTGGAALPLVLAIGAGVLAAGAGVGAGVGYTVAKHTGLSTFLAAHVSTGFAYAAVNLNRLAKNITGYSVDEMGAGVIGGVGGALDSAGKAIGGTKEHEQALENHNKSNEKHVPAVREVKEEKVLDRTEDQFYRKRAGQSEGSELPPPKTEIKSEEPAKVITKQEKAKEKATEIGGNIKVEGKNKESNKTNKQQKPKKQVATRGIN